MAILTSGPKKSHPTELLLVKMIENWRSPLDKNLVVGIVFDDVRKAFDSISHHVLLNKLQAFGFAGDLWCWIEDYLDDRSRASVGFSRFSVRNFTSEVWRATGICFETYPVFVVLQRSA